MDAAEQDIQLYNQSDSSIPFSKSEIENIVQLLEMHEDCHFHFLEVVYLDEDSIVEVNREQLNRDYITDVISLRYDNWDHNNSIEGTIYCCASRIYSQSKEYNEYLTTEFQRILIHGLLHLCGYEDSISPEKKNMSRKEDYYIKKLAQST